MNCSSHCQCCYFKIFDSLLPVPPQVWQSQKLILRRGYAFYFITIVSYTVAIYLKSIYYYYNYSLSIFYFIISMRSCSFADVYYLYPFYRIIIVVTIIAIVTVIIINNSILTFLFIAIIIKFSFRPN